MRRNQPRQSDIGAYSTIYQEEESEAPEYQIGSESDDKGAERQLPSTETEVKIENENMGKWLHIDGGAEIGKHISQFGLKGIKDVLLRNLDAWKEKPLDIAVTGQSGKGKSSLINALRNMSHWDKGAAKVVVKETTRDCTPYPHPKHDNIVLWDVPGAGTTNFPKLKKNYDEEKEFDKLKKDLHDEIRGMFGSNHFHFFMISNHHTDTYDFPLLLQQILEDVSNEKKLAMVFGIAGMSKTLIEEKALALRSRIWKCALASGTASAIPIPFLSTAIDHGIILEEVLFYRAQLALDDDSLEHLAHIANVSLNQLKREVDFKAPGGIFTAGGLTKYMMNYAKYTLPGIGLFIACEISFATTIGVLEGILDLMKEDAIMVLVSAKETTV